MFLDVRELELKPLRFEQSLPPGTLDFELDDLQQASPLVASGSAELLGVTEEIRVAGHLRVEIAAACDRCLEPMAIPVECDFDLLYRPESETLPGQEIEIAGAETEVAYYEGNGLELIDVLREQVLLSIPMHKFCREDCLGICPQCGQNKNAAPCGCQSKPLDDRWAALKDLRK